MKHSGIQQIEYEAPEQPAASPTATSASASGSSSGGRGRSCRLYALLCGNAANGQNAAARYPQGNAMTFTNARLLKESQTNYGMQRRNFLDKIIDSVTDSREDNQNPDTENLLRKRSIL